MSPVCSTIVLLVGGLQGQVDAKLHQRPFYVPENAKYTIADSMIDSLRFTLNKTLRRDERGHLVSISSFVDPEGKVMGWHDFGHLEGPGWAANAVGGAYEIYLAGKFLDKPDWQTKAVSILDHVLEGGFIDQQTGFIRGYRETTTGKFCLNYKHNSDWLCPGSMAKVAFQLLIFADQLGDDPRAQRMRRAAVRCAAWIRDHVGPVPNGWFARRTTPQGKVYRKSPTGGEDPFWQTSADGLFILQLQAALTARGLADCRQALREKTEVFMRAGGIFGSINHDTYDPHENVAYSVAFRTLLLVSRVLNDAAIREFAYDKCLAGLDQFKMSEDRNGVRTKGLLYMEKSWDTSYLWENAEAALAYFEAAVDTRRHNRAKSRQYELDGLVILRAAAKHHYGPHGFLTEGVDWNNHVGQQHHIEQALYAAIQYTEPFLNNQHITEPTLYYLEHLARTLGKPKPTQWRDMEGNVIFRRPADLVLLNGDVMTMDDAKPRAEAVAIRGDRLVAVGTDADVKRWVGKRTRVIDLKGKPAVPGFIDCHGHFVSLGQSKMILDLTKARSWDEVVRLVQEAARNTPPGRWILGRGWHQSKWNQEPVPNVQGYPTHEKLSRVTPGNPVLLTHASGHMSLANAKAMQLAGVDKNTPDPEGGRILRDRAGNAIGAFREEAMGLVARAHRRAEATRSAGQASEELDEAIRLATEECLRHGVTTFHDAGASFDVIDRFKELAESGRLGVRLWVMVGEPNGALAEKLPRYRLIGLGDHRLTVRAIKRFIDGALGVHGAWLLAPYDDLPESTGLNTTPLDSIRETARLAAKHDFQLCVHAIGDRANRETLNIFAETFRGHPEKADWRWRIEHAQHLHPDDFRRFSKLDVIASMQGIHCTSDAPFVVERLGLQRAKDGAYAWRSLLKSGALVVNGTDVPVEGISPIECFYASVTRRLADGSTFFPEQRMTRREALRSYTLDAAYAGFEEELKGSLVPGKLADVVVLSHNIITVPEEEIRQTRVLYTIVGGKVLYSRGD